MKGDKVSANNFHRVTTPLTTQRELQRNLQINLFSSFRICGKREREREIEKRGRTIRNSRTLIETRHGLTREYYQDDCDFTKFVSHIIRVQFTRLTQIVSPLRRSLPPSRALSLRLSLRRRGWKFVASPTSANNGSPSRLLNNLVTDRGGGSIKITSTVVAERAIGSS